MSAAIRTVTLSDGGEATYDSDMPMGVLRQMLSASSGGDLGGLIESLTSIVLSWSYDGEPSNDEDWNLLRRSEFNAVVTGVVEDLGKLGEV